MTAETSQWRYEAAWDERLRWDLALLSQSIGEEGMDTLAEVVRVTSEGLGEPDFVVVFGSRARQSIEDESDVDLYLEASWVSDDPERMPRIRERQDQLVFDLVALPRGMLLARLRTGDDVARAIVRDGRVYSDTGSYRQVAIAADEEGLE